MLSRFSTYYCYPFFLNKNLVIIINLILILSPNLIFSQSSNIGNPPIHNFLKSDYGAASQNWDIAQDEMGIMYFANNSGLLVFDGNHWRTYKVSNQSIVRSVEIADDGKIYVGAQGEIGYFFANEKGALVYTSLNSLFPPENQIFADVWDINIFNKNVYFRTGQSIFLYDGESLEIIYNGESLGFSTVIDKEYFIVDNGEGILRLDGNSFKQISENLTFDDMELNGIFPFEGDTLLVSSVKNGLFLYANNQLEVWKTNDNGSLKRGSIYCSQQLSKSTFVFGTSTEGILILNKKGKVLRNLNRKSGLQGNNILSLFVDNFQNLWAGLDNGIDYIETNSPFTYIYPDSDLKAMGYAIQIHDNRIYFGTANGVYYNDWKSYYNPMRTAPFELVKKSSGQVWDLSVNQGDLFLNHHEGSFIIDKDIAIKVSAKHGAWKQLQVGENKLLSGHYDGLVLLEKGKTWQKTKDFMHNWRESCRIVVQDESDNIWVSHPYRGVFKVQFNADYSEIKKIKKYNSENGFPSDIQIYVFKIGDEVVFCAEKGIYSYNQQTDRFEPNKTWNEIFGEETWVKRLIETPKGDIWYVTETEVGILNVKDGGIYKKVNKQIFPQLADKLVGGFEVIYPYDDKNIFIASESGFMHYNPKQTSVDTNYNALIRQVQFINNDSIIYAGYRLNDNRKPNISYRNNALRFRFAATYFGNSKNNTFQFRLEGFDDKWSAWTTKAEVDFTNLHSGSYTFYVRAKNINGIIGKTAMYSFKILPPWYASKLAVLLYFLLLGALLFLLIFIPKQQYEREKAALESEQKQRLLQKEKEHQQIEQERQHQISKLEKEKLELQIQAKNQELASNTMHLVQKSEILQKLKSEIKNIAKDSDNKSTAKQLRAIVRKISADEHLDADWQHFAQHFDQVHEQFLQRLREKHPPLTPKDHRLCAYLRMNLSSKEIAPLMNISVRSVEVARYRLRKKLELENDVNLVEFMVEI